MRELWSDSAMALTHAIVWFNTGSMTQTHTFHQKISLPFAYLKLLSDHTPLN